MFSYYKKTNEVGEPVQLLIVDYEAEPRTINAWNIVGEDLFVIADMQQIEREEYNLHFKKVELDIKLERQ